MIDLRLHVLLSDHTEGHLEYLRLDLSSWGTSGLDGRVLGNAQTFGTFLAMVDQTWVRSVHGKDYHYWVLVFSIDDFLSKWRRDDGNHDIALDLDLVILIGLLMDVENVLLGDTEIVDLGLLELYISRVVGVSKVELGLSDFLRLGKIKTKGPR